MPTVDFITFCHHRDVDRLAAPNELRNRIDSHQYPFDTVIVVKQRLRQLMYERTGSTESRLFPDANYEVESECYPGILSEYGVAEDQPKADEMTHGPTAPHYWKWHVINHLIGLKVSHAEYVVFSDADCRMLHNRGGSWVSHGIRVLQRHRDKVLIVSPSDGGDMAEIRIGALRLTQNVSQQMFLCERARLKAIDFDLPWDWEYTAPGGPFQEYYYLLEGRIWRWMHKVHEYRAILSDDWRYWHDAWH